MSRWAHWSSGTEEKKLGFSSFQLIAEAGKPVPGDPQQIIQQNGWEHRGYGYYVDGGGQTVARVQDGQLYMIDGEPNEVDKQIDTGNPTNQASGLKPADRARSMGLQSNGRGGYIDPKTGQTVARTVNNELVFYDQRPGGGAVSDGAGGQKIAQDTPSWQDPVTGLVVTPPAKPESAQEIAAIPDPIPAQSPSGYNKFIQQKKLLAYAKNKAQYDAEQDIESRAQQTQEIYAQEPEAQRWYENINKSIEAGIQSDDPRKAEIAAAAHDMLHDQAQEIVDTFKAISPDKHLELGNAWQHKIVRDSRFNWLYNNKIKPIEDDETLSPREKEEQIEIEENNPEYGRATFAGLKKGFGIRQMMQDAADAEAEYIDQKRPNTYKGDQVTYKLEDADEGTYNIDYITQMATETLGTPPLEVREVSWYPNESQDQIDNRQGAALDALKTWRREVLPDLEAGTVLVNIPSEGGRDDNQRARIYQLAGFGNENTNIAGAGGQAGIVVDDENGKRVIPLDGEDKAYKLRESIVCNLIDDEANLDERVQLLEVYCS